MGEPFTRGACLTIAILSLLATIADMVRDTTGLSAHPVYLAHAAGYAVLFAALFRIGFACLDWLERPGSSAGTLLNIPDCYTPRSIARLAAIIFCCWLPWLILTFPGVIWYDSRQQLLQFFGMPNVFTAGALSDHHPVFDTLLYGLFVQVGRGLGSADVGAYLFCLVQAAATAAALGACVILVRRSGATRRTLAVLLAVLCFFPHLPLYASAMAKDATFLPFLLAFTVFYIEAVRSRGAVFLYRGQRAPGHAFRHQALRSAHNSLCHSVLCSPSGAPSCFGARTSVSTPCSQDALPFGLPLRLHAFASFDPSRCHRLCLPRVAAFCLIACGMALTRKTGLIIVLIFCVALTVYLLRCRAQILVPVMTAAITALLMLVIMPFMILPALGAEPGGAQEALGLLFQQSSRVVREHGDELPPEELDAVESTLGDDVAQRYAWWITDTVKDQAIDTPLVAHMDAYLPVWAAQAVRYPITYLEAYLATQVGWYAVPTTAAGSYIMFGTPIDAHELDHTFEGSRAIGFSWSDTAIGTVLEALDEWVQSTPLGMVMLSKGFWSTWMLAFMIVACRRRCPERMMWLVPLIAVNVVLWISPTSVTREAMRYLLPLLFLVPVSCALVVGKTSRTAR